MKARDSTLSPKCYVADGLFENTTMCLKVDAHVPEYFFFSLCQITFVLYFTTFIHNE